MSALEIRIDGEDVVFLAGLYDPSATGKGNPWHDPHSGQFTFGPPGVRILRGAKSLLKIPNSSKWIIENRRRRFGNGVDAMTVDPMGQDAVVHLLAGPMLVDKFTVPLVEKVKGEKKPKGEAGRKLEHTAQELLPQSPQRVTYERVMHDLRNYALYLQTGERLSDAPGTRHLNPDERARMYSLRRELDDLVHSGVFRGKPTDVLEKVEIGRAKDRRKHLNPEERAQLQKWRLEQLKSKKTAKKVTGMEKRVGKRQEFTREDFGILRPWEEPPPLRKARSGKGATPGYSSDTAFKTNRRLGEEGEKIFAYFVGGERLHPETVHGEFDVRADGYLFEVKAQSVFRTAYKATPEDKYVKSKIKEAKQRGLEPAIAMPVVDSTTGKTTIYWRPGVHGGTLGESRGWRYLGQVDHTKIPGVHVPKPEHYAEEIHAEIHHDAKGPYTIDAATGFKVRLLKTDRRLHETYVKKRAARRQGTSSQTQGRKTGGARSVTKPHQHHMVVPRGTGDRTAEDRLVPTHITAGAKGTYKGESVTVIGNREDGKAVYIRFKDGKQKMVSPNSVKAVVGGEKKAKGIHTSPTSSPKVDEPAPGFRINPTVTEYHANGFKDGLKAVTDVLHVPAEHRHVDVTMLPPGSDQPEGNISTYTDGTAIVRLTTRKERDPQITVAHELGHYFDNLLGRRYATENGSKPTFLSEVAADPNQKGDSAMKYLLDTIRRTPEFNRLWEAKEHAETILEENKGNRDKTWTVHDRPYYQWISNHGDYALSAKETFARAFSQYIAAKTGNRAMIDEVNGRMERNSEMPILSNKQWDWGSFESVVKAFDVLFKEKGLLRDVEDVIAPRREQQREQGRLAKGERDFRKGIERG